MGDEDEQSRLILALEDFFCSPAFTCALGGFMEQHAAELQFVGPDAEQPLHNHAVFTRFQAVVEEQLCSFLQEHGISQEAVVRVCQAAKSRESQGTSQWVCIDWLLASTTYEAFMELAADHVQLHTWGAEPGALDDYELPPADKEEEGEMLPLDEGEEQGSMEEHRGAPQAAVASH